LVGIGAITGAVVFGQTQPGQTVKRPANSLPDTPGGYVIQELAPGGPVFFAPGQDETSQLVNQIRKAEKEEDKKEFKKKLADVLGKQFDAHMKQQDDELTALEKQINDLKELMKKRLAARTTIIDRRMDQLLNDAEGLGWNAPGHPQHSPLWAQPNPYRSSSSAGRFPGETKRGN
jgi:polyhydroxyalkanoate synthesis regulator phasin